MNRFRRLQLESDAPYDVHSIEHSDAGRHRFAILHEALFVFKSTDCFVQVTCVLTLFFLFFSHDLISDWLATFKFLSLIVEFGVWASQPPHRTVLAISGPTFDAPCPRCFLYLWSTSTTLMALSFDRPRHDVASSSLWFATKAHTRIQAMAHQRNLILTYDIIH